MRQSAYRRIIHVVCLVSGLLSLSFFDSAFGDSNVGAMSQEAQRAEKRALIVIDDYIIGPEDIITRRG